jgi:predicted small lipoprotein YifL
MKRVYCWLFVLGLTISTIGCGGDSGPATLPPDTGEVAPEEPDMSGDDLVPPDPGPPPP